ncbi:MAG: hypothetical protein AAF889_11755 [Cyanobacteria bacterium P01_D01_bin.73]
MTVLSQKTPGYLTAIFRLSSYDAAELGKGPKPWNRRAGDRDLKKYRPIIAGVD